MSPSTPFCHSSPATPPIDDPLSDDEKAVRASVRQLCADRIDPHVADWFERGEMTTVWRRRSAHSMSSAFTR